MGAALLPTVNSVRFEHLDEALGIGTGSPRLSWQVTVQDAAWEQTAYEVDLDGGTPVRVESSEQVLVPWPFEPLTARQRALVRVRVASGKAWSDWSEPAVIEVGLLHPEDWSARFITPSSYGSVGAAAPTLSRIMTFRDEIASARLYATAHGVYEATVNGHRVGNEILAPGWTSYRNRLQYQTYDVAQLLQQGENTLEVLLGNGWYRGGPNAPSRVPGGKPVYGDRLALLAQLEVTYSDGSVELIGTDDSWTAHESHVVEDDIYHGQCTDLRRRQVIPEPVKVLDEDLGRLVAPTSAPVRVTDVLPSVKVFQSASGKTLVDFGQNLVGWVRLRVQAGQAADQVVVRHSEVLEHGELSIRQLGEARATDSYVIDASVDAVLEPSLTFHGFRFAEVTGVPTLSVEDVEAVVVGSDLRRTGWFSCSDPQLEQLHSNVVWSTRGNFLHIPTDCPQRAERLGWTGDIQVFAPTASFLFDVAGFLESWLADLAAEQYADGSLPYVIPKGWSFASSPACGWGDAATVVPEVLYYRYGDAGVLGAQFDSMRRWVDKVASLTTDGVWAGGFQFGDWVDPSAPPNEPGAAKADPDVVATAYLARSADIVAEAARLLGREAAAQRYAELAERTREAYARHYVTASGRILSDAQTVYAQAIEWALLPSAEQREAAGRRLTDLVRANGFRIGTGFLGTPLMTDALSSVGRVDLAYRMLLEQACPSWLYPVSMGATTIWERWDSMLPDGSVNPGRMVSFNHYALGAVADWIHRTVAGLAPAAPGYRRIVVQPVPHHALTHASARHLTPYGEASVAWRRADGQLTVEAVIPVGATATVRLPGAQEALVGHGRHSWTVTDPCDGAPPAAATIRDLMDGPLWSQSASLMIEHGLAENPIDLAKRVERHLHRPVLDLPGALNPWTGVDEAQKALEELLDGSDREE
ncbi:family 78 glycoside hydrolase catalytic domain [Streptomyces sp. NPDC004752]